MERIGQLRGGGSEGGGGRGGGGGCGGGGDSESSSGVFGRRPGLKFYRYPGRGARGRGARGVGVGFIIIKPK